MHEGESTRVKCLAREERTNIGARVLRVTDDRPSAVAQVHTDLVGTAGL